MKRTLLMLVVLTTFLHTSVPLFAQQGRGQGLGQGQGFGRGFRGGRSIEKTPGNAAAGENAETSHVHDDRHDADRDVFQFLLANHKEIVRQVKELPGGVETLTESKNPEIAGKIKEHVQWMEHRVQEVQPIRMRDPLFAEIFKHADKIDMTHEETENGVKVTETSTDPYVAKLIQAHAKVVSGFVERGHAEAMKNHSVPNATSDSKELKTATPIFPIIPNHGSVITFPNAAHQPRDKSKLLVDITQAADAAAINPSIEKVAKYVNIFAGGGKKPATASVAVIFHGESTLAVLNDDAYSAKYQLDANPNLELLHQLHEAGVELYVCGQTLVAKGASEADVAVFVDTAVSAMTVVVNLQQDGYIHIPLGK